jgi:hypothetical protein
MKTTIILISALCIFSFAKTSDAQRYATRNGNISFYSEAPLENIEAFNSQVNSALDIGTGDFVFRVLMKAFQFEKALMQEHFNENYVESHKHPNANFTGKVMNMSEIDFTKPGKYPATIEGELTIKGITKKVAETGIFEVLESGNLHGTATFEIAIADYDIRIPRAVVNNIAEQIEIKVDVVLNPL